MLLTAPQALFHYHQVYHNATYQAACTALAVALNGADPAQARQHPIYLHLANLLTDAALEHCGHPAYHGVGWTLAYTLHTHGLATPPVLAALHAHLEPFRVAHARLQDQLENHPADQLTIQLEVAHSSTGAAMQTASQLQHWQGRTAYHLLAAASGLLTTAGLYLRYDASQTTSHHHYIAEKIQRALRDVRYGLSEVQQHQPLPMSLARLLAALRRLQEK